MLAQYRTFSLLPQKLGIVFTQLERVMGGSSTRTQSNTTELFVHWHWGSKNRQTDRQTEAWTERRKVKGVVVYFGENKLIVGRSRTDLSLSHLFFRLSHHPTYYVLWWRPSCLPEKNKINLSAALSSSSPSGFISDLFSGLVCFISLFWRKSFSISIKKTVILTQRDAKGIKVVVNCLEIKFWQWKRVSEKVPCFLPSLLDEGLKFNFLQLVRVLRTHTLEEVLFYFSTFMFNNIHSCPRRRRESSTFSCVQALN